MRQRDHQNVWHSWLQRRMSPNPLNPPAEVVLKIAVLVSSISDLTSLHQLNKSFFTAIDKSPILWKTIRAKEIQLEPPSGVDEVSYCYLLRSNRCFHCKNIKLVQVFWEFRAIFCKECYFALTMDYSSNLIVSHNGRCLISDILRPASLTSKDVQEIMDDAKHRYSNMPKARSTKHVSIMNSSGLYCLDRDSPVSNLRLASQLRASINLFWITLSSKLEFKRLMVEEGSFLNASTFDCSQSVGPSTARMACILPMS